MAISKVTLPVILGIAIASSGCSILEKIWLVPEVETEVLFDPVLGNKDIIDAVTLAVSDLEEMSFLNWHKNVTFVNVMEGELETGHYDRPNSVGAKLRAEIDRDDQLVRLNVKGTHIYYTDIPLQQGLREIQTAVVCRLDEALKRVKKDNSPH